MTAEVVEFDGITRLDIPVERVLRRATERDLESVIVIGTTKDGGEYFASSAADGGSVLWSMERAKMHLLGIPDRDDLGLQMPVLSNARHERFAQELAKGKCQSEAYEAAGYKPSRSAASRLAEDVNICARVREIQERGAIRAEVTIASLTADLMRLREKGEKIGEAPGLSVARQSIMDIAKLNGLIVDKSLTAATTVEDMLDALDGKAGEAR